MVAVYALFGRLGEGERNDNPRKDSRLFVNMAGSWLQQKNKRNHLCRKDLSRRRGH